VVKNKQIAFPLLFQNAFSFKQQKTKQLYYIMHNDV